MTALGTALATDRGRNAPDVAAAERWLRAAADAGRPDTAVTLGYISLADDSPMAGGVEEAVARFSAANDAGSGDALEELGMCRLPSPHFGRGRGDVAAAVACFPSGVRTRLPGVHLLPGSAHRLGG